MDDELNFEFEQLSVSNPKEEIQKILSEQSKLKEEMQTNLNKQSKLNDRIKSILTRLQHDTFFNDNYFPLDNDDDLNYMENKISKMAAVSEFKSLLVDDLIFIGGDDIINDMVKRIMTKLFTMQLVSKYSRTGGSKSRNFSELKIYQVILDAIKKNFSATPEMIKDFEGAIDNHLKVSKKFAKRLS